MSKQKIVITGALGYLGTELCKLYSGEARYKDIIAIDNRFISARVEQLSHWGIVYHQGSILDKDFLQEHLKDAGIVYHLAGITDVAYTATQANKEQDKLIRSVGVDGTQSVINNMPSTGKLIFPSTHVVFEGLQSTTFDIDEELLPCPVLTYAEGKAWAESRIRESLYCTSLDPFVTVPVKHIIVRLGSVYGYSGDTMRIGIMPNKFASIAAQNGTISMYGGGQQYKSLVHVVDVVRAMKFLAESEHTGTYHLSNENMTVRDVAQICKDINPNVILQSTDDEVPNKGYTLSNRKLLSTGFQFRYNIRDAIQDMITRWSLYQHPETLEYIVRGGKDYIDSRGRISNYELPEPINLIGYIESRAGTVRANHYHPIQEQKCLLISGRYISVIKDLSYPDAPLEYRIIKPGDIAVIRPNVAHTMVFLQDSVFLNLVNGEREHANYGITHTIPYILVDDEHRDTILDKYRVEYKTECRCCNSRRLTQVLSLGESPLANNLLDSIDQECITYPLDLMYCQDCYNVQLSVVVPAGKMFDNYLYVSSTSPVFRQHFEQAADKYIQEFNLTSDSVVWDIGSNDGVFLRPLKDGGIRVCGIEPAANVAQIANESGIPTVHGYFNQDTAAQAYHSIGSPDIVTASNVFAHADDLRGITQTVFNNLKQGGVFIIEVQYLIDTIQDMTFDNIYHEHVNYWSVTALNTFFSSMGLSLFHVEHIDTHGGSIRCYIGRDITQDSTVSQFMTREGELGIHSADTFREFARRVQAIKDNVLRNMKTLRHIFPHIAAYGSPAKATTALNYYGITSQDIWYSIEDNVLKHGRYIPGTGICIAGLHAGIDKVPDIVIVLAWNFFDSIRAKVPSHIPCISIKDLQPDSISFCNLLSGRYTQAQPNTYIVDTQDFAYKLVVQDYWKDQYHQKAISVIPDCYNSMLNLIRNIPKDRYIVDIGANCGILAIPCAMMGYKVLAFDPAAANISAIVAAIQVNNLATLTSYRLAISDKDIDTEVYVPECPDNTAMDSDIAIAKMENKVFSVEQVQAITFDTWIEQNPQYRNIGLIKIDVQGHEDKVIQGMKQFLSTASNLYILCEFDYSLGDGQTALLDSILSCGFRELPAITNEDKLFYKA